MRNIIAAAALTAALATAASAGATEFVTNGTFTNLTTGLGQLGVATTAVGWSTNPVSPSYEFVFAVADQAVNGQYGALSLWDAANGGANAWNGLAAGPGNFVALDGAFQDAALQQTINGLTIGQTYHLSFNYAFAQQTGFSGDTTQNLSVSLGAFSATSSDIVLPNHGFSGWGAANFDIVATATSETLSFLSVASPQLPPFALVSNVSLTGGVPEPATWAMMLVGFGGLGALIRRRARRAVEA